MPIPIPSGVLPIQPLTSSDILSGDRVTSYRWEVLTHSGGTDHLYGELDGVVEGSASLSWTLYSAVKGSGSLRVTDLAEPREGMIALKDVHLESARIRPVCVIEGLPEIPLGTFLISSAPEEWTGTGKTVALDLLDRTTVLDQDQVEATYTVDAETPILAAVAAVVASAGESISVDAAVTDTLSSPMAWPAGTSKLQIINDLLGVLNYSSLWVDGVGNLRATPYVVPARRSLQYELLNEPRELVDGESSIYSEQWTRDRDIFGVPNRVIAVQTGGGEDPALVGVYTNEDPSSPFSYPSRGRWISRTLEVETPDADEAEVVAFLEAKAQQSLIAASAVQASIEVKHLPVPLLVGDVLRFRNVPAGVDARHVVTGIELEAHPLGLMASKMQEVVDL